MTAMQMMFSYGAMGICCVYFMFKDFKLNKEITEALHKFTVAINLLTGGKGDIDE